MNDETKVLLAAILALAHSTGKQAVDHVQFAIQDQCRQLDERAAKPPAIGAGESSQEAQPERPARPLGEIHTDAVMLAAALNLIDRMRPTNRQDQAGIAAVIAMAAPLARKVTDDLEEAL